MDTLHSKTLLSSTNPAENPSTGFLQRSAKNTKKKKRSTKFNNLIIKFSHKNQYFIISTNKRLNFIILVINLWAASEGGD